MAEPKKLDVSVQWAGTLSVGPGKASFAVTIPKSEITLKEAEKFLCGSRLTITATVDPAAQEDAEGQSKIFPTDIQIVAVVDVLGYSVRPKSITVRMSLPVDDSPEIVEKLTHFVKRNGRTIAERIGASGED